MSGDVNLLVCLLSRPDPVEPEPEQLPPDPVGNTEVKQSQRVAVAP